MDPLLKAVKSGSLDAVKKVVLSEGIPFDSRWIDYISINQAIVDEQEEIVEYLLDHNCRVKNNDENVVAHETPLHSAVKRNSAKLAVKLLEKGASLESLNYDGYSPLHLALILKHEAIIDVILNFIVKTDNYVNVKGKNGLTHFHIACTRNNVEVIEGFIKFKVNINEAIDENSDYYPSYTAKHFAAEFQSLEAVKVLMNTTGGKCSFVNDKNGQSPIEIARKSLEKLSIMVYLLSGESQSNAIGYPTKMSQFHMACAQDNPKLVKKFIENGAAVNNFISDNATFCPGYSPLHCAVQSNCKENVELLLKEHAYIQHQDANFATPLHLALYNEDPEQKDTIVDLLYKNLSVESKMFNIMDIYGLDYFHLAVTRNELDLVKAFLDRGEDIEHKVMFNHLQFTFYTPLHFAIRYKHLEMTKFLIERGADVTAISKDGSPLHIAIEVGQTEIIDLLLEYKLKANLVRSIDGKTMLHSLVEKYMKNCEKIDKMEDVNKTLNYRLLTYIERLFNLGCDANHRDDDGNTVLHIACEKICYGIPCVRLLLNLGADINVENADGNTPFNCAFQDSYRMNAYSYMLLYHHVQKLKVLGFWVNLKNEHCCQRILDESNECDPNAECFKMAHLDYMKQRRRYEVTLMKSVKLTKAMSLYGFVRLNKTDAVLYVENEKLQEIIKNKEELNEKYPIYGYLIKLQFLRVTRYLEFLANENRSAKRKRCEE